VKLILKQQNDIVETVVEIHYAQLDTMVQDLIKRVEQSNQYICGEDNGRQYRILPDDIYYIESVDKKTFVYTETKVFRCDMKLYQILEKLKSTDFVQVSKSCILNINMLDNIHTLYNSKMEGTLINGEKIIISRTFIPNIKTVFVKERGNAI
jgi:DNA-binding LytR/AlgR family response regulator